MCSIVVQIHWSPQSSSSSWWLVGRWLVGWNSHTHLNPTCFGSWVERCHPCQCMHVVQHKSLINFSTSVVTSHAIAKPFFLFLFIYLSFFWQLRNLVCPHFSSITLWSDTFFFNLSCVTSPSPRSALISP